MARKYAIGDTIRLTRTVCVNHFVPQGMSIVGEIVEIRKDGHRELANWDKPGRNYGIKFTDRPGVWWYAGWEFKRVKRG